jgi:D-alanyl-lipoteichoic acid acyltransferase DltB (MBOAT superfamily)
MLFNSLAFGIFLAAVLAGYFLLRRHHRAQNALLLAASLASYGFWDARFLALLAASIAVNFLAGRAIHQAGTLSRRRLWLGVALGWDLAVLGAFKYFNFFAASLARGLALFGIEVDQVTLNLVLPLGLSFYTFQAITYPFDIYRGRLEPTRSLLDFGLFVSFFPTLVSGPIERASHLLPQIAAPRRVTADSFNEGLALIIWGYFQKLVIADNLALLVNGIYGGYTQYQGLDIALGILAYTFQIFADFAGYTDIARGVARLLGFQLRLNFNLPYFATSPPDFWNRWHMSLSSWLRDYLYIPLGGNRKGRVRTGLNLLVTMGLCGLWHGAAWTFVVWGLYHGALLVIQRIPGRGAVAPVSRPRRPLAVLKALGMFILVAAGWAVFRASSLTQAGYLFSHLGVGWSAETLGILGRVVFFAWPLVVMQAVQARTGNPLPLAGLNPWLRGLVYALIIAGCLVFNTRENVRFIYQGF